MPNTAGFKEKLVHCDVQELNVPAYDEDLIALKGDSVSQTTFASNMRVKKMREWQPDLPDDVFCAIKGIADATWWLANQNKDSASIGWPHSWASLTDSPSQPELGQPVSSVRESRDRLLGSKIGVPDADIEQFDTFAKKACQSPEMSYLTMMALLYRQTKSPKVLAKFTEARQRVDGYLDAIDNIVGSSDG